MTYHKVRQALYEAATEEEITDRELEQIDAAVRWLDTVFRYDEEWEIAHEDEEYVTDGIQHPHGAIAHE